MSFSHSLANRRATRLVLGRRRAIGLFVGTAALLGFRVSRADAAGIPPSAWGQVTREWECVNGHHCVDTLDAGHAIEDILDCIRCDEEVSIDLECLVCSEVGTDDGLWVSSDDPYIQGMIDLEEHRDYCGGWG